MKLTKRKGFNFFRSYYDVYNELSDKDKVAFMDALLDRQFLGIKPTKLTGMSKFAYISQTNSIDSQVKGYEDKTGVTLTPPRQGATDGGTYGGPTPPSLQVEVEGKEKGKEKVQVQDVFRAYNLFADKYSIPKIQKLTDARKKLVSARLKNPEDLKKVFEKISNSDFLLNGSFVSFDWIFKQQNFLKILEGNYDNKTPNKKNHGERLQEIYNSLNQ